jgi:hypothetical protein
MRDGHRICGLYNDTISNDEGTNKMTAIAFYTRVETPRCRHCGYKGEVEVLNSGLFRWRAGTLIQEALPDLGADLREQLMTGMHPECWKEMFDETQEDIMTT